MDTVSTVLGHAASAAKSSVVRRRNRDGKAEEEENGIKVGGLWQVGLVLYRCSHIEAAVTIHYHSNRLEISYPTL